MESEFFNIFSTHLKKLRLQRQACDFWRIFNGYSDIYLYFDIINKELYPFILYIYISIYSKYALINSKITHQR